MPTRPKKRCTDCGDVHLCKATYPGSKRDQEKNDDADPAAKPDGKRPDAKPAEKKRSFLDRLLGDEDDDL